MSALQNAYAEVVLYTFLAPTNARALFCPYPKYLRYACHLIFTNQPSEPLQLFCASALMTIRA
jgi:hypothetical protein